MSLDPSVHRCQGAAAIFANPIQRGSLPADCIKCARRTDITPGYSHTYMQAPTWLPWMHCPMRIEPKAPDGDEVVIV